MKEGDLVTLSAKGNQLDWVRKTTYFRGEKPLYGVIVMKRTLPKKSSYKVHWFYRDGFDSCADYILFYRDLLKQLK